ncbi:alpha/beta hydrolase [Thermodesulfobacteriota bacterium]
MIDISKIDYSTLDRPEILKYLFHPRTEWASPRDATPGQEIFIPVEDDFVIGGRFHMTTKSAASILFFHGNGEIVSDYDEMGPLYNRMGINFLPVDYRGYGRSTGTPTITAMMRDCHVIFDFVGRWLKENSYSGQLIIMGRSLGSASVLELAASYPDLIDALIIESGFAYVEPLLQLLGINPDDLDFKEEAGFRNVDKIRKFTRPALIIHAEYDHIIPFSDGQALYDACQSREKTFLKIPKANHNDIFRHGASEYLSAVKRLVQKTI